MLLDSRLPFSVLQLCRQCLKPTPRLARHVSTTTPALSPPPPPPTLGEFPFSQRSSLSDQEARDIILKSTFGDDYQRTLSSSQDLDNDKLEALLARSSTPNRPPQPHHLHVYATKHNTHITLATPDHDPIISKSTGNIGFRKSSRGTYDAAYQLSAFILSQIYEGGMLSKIKRLEVVLRGFGVGREAVTKALLGAEGRRLRPVIAQVTDTTRLKFGGTRSRKPRRLG